MMHILHGTWDIKAKQGLLWGEDTAATKKSGVLTTVSTRLNPKGKAIPHPFPLSQDQWLRYLDRFAPETDPDGREVIIWLPGTDRQAQPSPEAVAAGLPILESALTLRPWQIPMVTLPKATDFLYLLLHLPDRVIHHAKYKIGSDLAFWQQAANMLISTLIEQRFSPVIEAQPARYIATWQLQPDPDWIEELVYQMPASCRAITDNADEAPHPRRLLDDFLQTATDLFIREIGTYIPFTQQPVVHALVASAKKRGISTPITAQSYAVWQNWIQADGSGKGASEGAFRVCFRLEEAADSDQPWLLRYLLQAHDDPSLLVDAELIWSAPGRTLHYLEYRFDDPQEKLLKALGLVSTLFPPIERSLSDVAPASVALTSTEAYQFLSEVVPVLEDNRFGVQVPSWWIRHASRLKAHATVKSKTENSSGLLGMNRLIQYKWELSVGDKQISRTEFEELVGLKQPLVRFRGEWITLSPAQIEAAITFLNKQDTEDEMSLLDTIKFSVPEADTDLTMVKSDLEFDPIQIEGILFDVFDKLYHPDQIELPAIPAGLQATLRPYQQRGFGWLVQMYQLGLGACLADDMGLGKTLQTIAFWLYAQDRLPVRRPALLICPTSVVGNWWHELSHFAPSLRVYTHHGQDRLRGEAFSNAIADVDVVLTSYALLSRDLATLKAVPWFCLVLDEAQNIKNSVTKQAQAARAIHADQRLALTGTPVENQLSELWSILNFLNPGYLGSHEMFRKKFSIPIERAHDEKAAETLRKLTAPLLLRRLKTDPTVISDLPDKLENKVYCSLTAEQATLYEAVVREELEAIEKAVDPMSRRGGVLRMLTRLKQICNHPAHFLKETETISLEKLTGRSGKLARLTEMLEEVYSVGDRALVFTQYAEMGKVLQGYLQEKFSDPVLFLYGQTPAKKREEMVQLFQSPSGPLVFILSLKAGGTGLNLTHASHVFHFDRWYNPAVENQATDRAFRIGQKHNVQVHKFICLGTLEERIDEMIEQKKGLAERIVGAGEGWLSEMNTNELRDLVTLRREMIQEVE
jgi:SNF2 family DNA or RNA helicase